MTKEALKLALDALEDIGDEWGFTSQRTVPKRKEAITAIKKALANEALEKMAENARELGLDYEPAQPFITHNVEQPYDWSEWVCPDPKNYLMKCCDCGLVHEAQFAVVRYKSETEREDCDMVDDPNLQAVFRMRRSEQWSPEDTAHRSGGLPMAQPEPWEKFCDSNCVWTDHHPDCKLAQPEQEPVAWEGGEGWESLAWELCADENGEDSCNELIWEGGPIPEPWGDRWMKYEEEAKRLIALVQKHITPPQRKPLTDEEIETYRYMIDWTAHWSYINFARAIEAAHGIKGEA